MTQPATVSNEALKHAVAQCLGLLVMEYSRLEMEVGLVLHAANGGRDGETVARLLRRADFNKRLAILRDYLGDHADVDPAYRHWVNDANAARKLRNRLMHGRWDFGDPATPTFTVVRGDPFSDEQETTQMSLPELEAQLQRLKALRRRLAELREKSPL
jgi:hypothetical protein